MCGCVGWRKYRGGFSTGSCHHNNGLLIAKDIGHLQLFPTERAFVISLDNEKSFFVFCSYRLLFPLGEANVFNVEISEPNRISE
jgi:hypothetical protein